MDNTLDYQPSDRKMDSLLLRSFGGDFKPRSRLRMTRLSLWSGCADMFLDLSLHQTVRSSNATVLNKIVQQCMSQSLSTRLTKCVSADPRLWRYLSKTHFLTSLRRRFPVIFTMF